MCELNPKRTQIFRLEFFTSAEITEEQWQQLVLPRLLALEQEFNTSGEVRVHVHEIE